MISMQKKENILRIASYNILGGGKTRLDSISKVITEINPDICGLLEAVEWQNDIKHYKDIANNLGYSFFNLGVANSKYNIAIFSKVLLTIKTIKKGIQHVVLEASVESGPFKDLHIFFVHLSPISEDNRLLEIEELLKYIEKLSEVIIIGDFNSLSPHDPYNQEELLKIFKENKVTKYGTQILRFDVIKKIESSGLADAANYLNYPFTASTPTPSNQDINHIANIRIDYAFLTKNILQHLKNIEIFKNNIADEASDHYPLFIDLLK